jgi:putative membrane protein
MRWLMSWILNAAILMLLPHILSSVRLAHWSTALWAALVLSGLNTLVRPVLVWLTLPVTILTLGLFLLVIHGLTFWLAARFVPGFEVSGFGSAMLAALLYSVLSTLITAIVLRRNA